MAKNETITTVAEGTRLLTTQTGKERERFSRLYGVFLEDDEEVAGEFKLVQRNFPSQRIMNDWMERAGWTHPDRAGRFVIYRGTPLKGLKVTQDRDLGQVEEQGVQAIPAPTFPRLPAAPKPVVPSVAEAEASDVSDVSTPDEIDVESLMDEDGAVVV